MGSTTPNMDPVFCTQRMKFKVQSMQCNILVPQTQLSQRGIVQDFQFCKHFHLHRWLQGWLWCQSCFQQRWGAFCPSRMRKKKLLKQFQELPGDLEIIRQNSGAAGVNLEVPCGISMVCLESWMYSQSRFAICVSVLQGKEYSLETAKVEKLKKLWIVGGFF